MPSAADLEDGMEGKKQASPWRIFSLARPEWPWLGLGLVFLTMSLLPYLFLPIAIGRILDALGKDTSAAEKEAELGSIVIFLVSNQHLSSLKCPRLFSLFYKMCHSSYILNPWFFSFL